MRIRNDKNQKLQKPQLFLGLMTSMKNSYFGFDGEYHILSYKDKRKIKKKTFL